MYLEKYDLKGRTALVIGAGRCIGLACCQALAEAGECNPRRQVARRGESDRPAHRRAVSSGVLADLKKEGLLRQDAPTP